MRRETLVRERHLERLALVYVRQSTPGQVLSNRESTRLQYGLRERAGELGWPPERIETIDEDLGVSGSGATERTGFARMILEVARGRVGAVFGLDPSRFARNAAEWFELLRWLRLTQTLLVTDEGVYDPGSGEDSFVLGIHGTLSEGELYKLKARMEQGKWSKARRGELYVHVPAGYVVDGTELRKDADEHVREAIGRVFAKFRELGSARQVSRALRAAGLQLPVRQPGQPGLSWRPANYTRVWGVLRNPMMGGAYAWGRKRTDVRLDERDQLRKRQRKLPLDRWGVLLPEHHEGYVGWQEWLSIQERLEANRVDRGDREGGGAPREGRALLQGLAVCGQCGRAMQVRYGNGVQYKCRRSLDDEGGCQTLGGERLDKLAAEAFLEAAGPGGVEAALRAERLAEREADERLLGYRREVERREWVERKARKEYGAVEAEFRRVKRTLARDWERAQDELERAREALEQARRRPPRPPEAALAGSFDGLGTRLRELWEHPRTAWRDRKRLLATLLEEVVLTADRKAGRLHVLLRWRGGWIDERELRLSPPLEPRRTDASTVALVARLAGMHADKGIAAELRRQGRRTACGLEFTAKRVAALRWAHGIAACRLPAPAAGEQLRSVADAARELGVSVSSLYRWIEQGFVPAEQAGPGEPLQVRLDAAARARFRDTVPDGFVPVAAALRQLGVSRQTLWEWIRAQSVAALRIPRGPEKGLYVKLERSSQPLLEGFETGSVLAGDGACTEPAGNGGKPSAAPESLA